MTIQKSSVYLILLSLSLDSDTPVTFVNPRKASQSSSDKSSSRGHTISSILDSPDIRRQEGRSKSSTLPSSRSKAPPSPKHLAKMATIDLPGFPYRPPSPILYSGSHKNDRQATGGGKSANSKRSLFRRRAESVDQKIRNV